MSAIEIVEQYLNNKKQTAIDIKEHLETLKLYASKAKHVTELGVRGIVSTWAFLSARPKRLLSVDIYNPAYFLHDHGDTLNLIDSMSDELGVYFTFIQADDLKIEIEPTDLLFIDTLHTYDQLSKELTIHGNKSKKWIIMHDTEVGAEYHVDSRGVPVGGMKYAIQEFLDKNKVWEVKEVFHNNNGLTVLERCPAPKNQFWIVTAYQTDFTWIKEYTDNYIIYDKSGTAETSDKVVHQKNVGYNIYDIMNFIVEHYENLPEICVFIKANIFNRVVNGFPNPHCRKEKFDQLISNTTFTPLESYENVPITRINKKTPDGGYMELNDIKKYTLDQYITPLLDKYGSGVCRYYRSFDTLFRDLFQGSPPEWYRFAPGGNYIVPKENILFYSKNFYEKLRDLVSYHQYSAESHIIERMLYIIFSNQYKEK